MQMYIFMYQEDQITDCPKKKQIDETMKECSTRRLVSLCEFYVCYKTYI